MSRKAKIRLDEEVLSSLLALPPGYEIKAVDARNDPFGVYLIVFGPDLPEIPPEAEAPLATVKFRVQRTIAVDEIVWPEQTCPGGC